jgi:hypothetical protein
MALAGSRIPEIRLGSSVAVLALQKSKSHGSTNVFVRVLAAPLDFVLCTEWLKEVGAFFSYPGPGEMTDKLAGQLYAIRHKTESDVLAALSESPIVDVSVGVGAPRLVLPLSVTANASPIAVVSLGNVEFSSVSSAARMALVQDVATAVRNDRGDADIPHTSSAPAGPRHAHTVDAQEAAFDKWALRISDVFASIESGDGKSRQLIKPLEVAVSIHSCVLPSLVDPNRVRVHAAISAVSLTLFPAAVVFSHGIVAQLLEVSSVIDAASSGLIDVNTPRPLRVVDAAPAASDKRPMLRRSSGSFASPARLSATMGPGSGLASPIAATLSPLSQSVIVRQPASKQTPRKTATAPRRTGVGSNKPPSFVTVSMKVDTFDVVLQNIRSPLTPDVNALLTVSPSDDVLLTAKSVHASTETSAASSGGTFTLASVTLTALGSQGEEPWTLLSSEQSDASASEGLMSMRYKLLLAPASGQIPYMVSLRMSALNVRWNPDVVGDVYGYLSGIGTLFALPSTASSPVASADDVVFSDPSVGPRMRIDVALEKIELTLFKPRVNRTLASVTLNHTTVTMTTADDCTTIEGSSTNLVVSDLRPVSTRYRTVLGGSGSVSGRDLVSFKAIMFPPHVAATRGCNMSLQVSLNSVHVVYLQQLWMEVIDYFLNGVLGALVLQSLQSAGDFVAARAADRNSLDVLVAGPVIVIPISPTSNGAVTVHAESLRVNNDFSCEDRSANGTNCIVAMLSWCFICSHTSVWSSRCVRVRSHENGYD